MKKEELKEILEKVVSDNIISIKTNNMRFFTCEDGSYINLNHVVKFKTEEIIPKERYEACAYLSNSQRVILIVCESEEEGDECIENVLSSTNSYVETNEEEYEDDTEEEDYDYELEDDE